MKDYIKNRLFPDSMVFKIGGDFLEIKVYRIDDENGKIVGYEIKDNDTDIKDFERLAKVDCLMADTFKQIYEQKLILDKILKNEIDFEYLKKMVLKENLTTELFKKIMFLKNYINNLDDKEKNNLYDKKIGYDFCEDFYITKIKNLDNLIQVCNNNAEDSKQVLDKKILKEQLEIQKQEKELEYINEINKNIMPNNSKRLKI